MILGCGYGESAASDSDLPPARLRGNGRLEIAVVLAVENAEFHRFVVSALGLRRVVEHEETCPYSVCSNPIEVLGQISCPGSVR